MSHNNAVVAEEGFLINSLILNLTYATYVFFFKNELFSYPHPVCAIRQHLNTFYCIADANTFMNQRRTRGCEACGGQERSRGRERGGRGLLEGTRSALCTAATRGHGRSFPTSCASLTHTGTCDRRTVVTALTARLPSPPAAPLHLVLACLISCGTFSAALPLIKDFPLFGICSDEKNGEIFR